MEDILVFSEHFDSDNKVFIITLGTNVAIDFLSAIPAVLVSVANEGRPVEVAVHHQLAIRVISPDHRNWKVLRCLDKFKIFN